MELRPALMCSCRWAEYPGAPLQCALLDIKDGCVRLAKSTLLQITLRLLNVHPFR